MYLNASFPKLVLLREKKILKKIVLVDYFLTGDFKLSFELSFHFYFQ